MKSSKKDIVAIITARGGSKGLPGKNIYPLCDLPLIAYTIIAAQQSKFISRIIVSTDDEKIANVCNEYDVEVLIRPKHLATDKALSRDVLLHVLTELENSDEDNAKYFMLLQPTSPLRTSRHIDDLATLFFAGSYGSAVSVSETEHSPEKMFEIKNEVINPLFGYEYLDMPRQSLRETYQCNGAMYMLPVKSFLDEKSFFIRPILPFSMTPEESIDIDTEMDIKICEFFLRK